MRRGIFAAVWALSLLYVASWINRGWIPHDDGLLGQTAERFLRGELPHRDFDDPYTGGLTVFHGLAFAAFGVRLIAMRIALFMAMAAWVPVVYAIARRFADPLVAGLATLLAVAWSVPNYPSSLPSWYNLFLASGGLLALLKYTETRGSRWLCVAGICGGLSVLIKIVGLYFLGAAGLVVLFTAFESAADPPDGGRPVGAGIGNPLPSRARDVPAAAVGIAAALVLVAVSWRLLRRGASEATYFQLVAPGVAIAIVIADAGLRARRLDWPRLWMAAGALSAGVAIPIVPWLAVYVHEHAVGALINGVFILPGRRLTFASEFPQGRPVLVAGAAAIGVVLMARVRRPLVGLAVIGVMMVVVAGFFVPQARSLLDQDLMEAARAVLPLLAVAYAAAMVSPWRRRASVLRREQAFAAIVVAALGALVQYPFYAWIYFFYVAPLAIIAVLAYFATFGQPVGRWVGTVAMALALALIVNHMPLRPDSHSLAPAVASGCRSATASSTRQWRTRCGRTLAAVSFLRRPTVPKCIS